MKSKPAQFLGSATGGFAFAALFWACSAPDKSTAGDTCDCASDIAALEARIATLEASAADTEALDTRLTELEASAVQQVGGEATVPASTTDTSEGGQVNLAAASAYGTGFGVDVAHDSFRVIQMPDSGGGGVVFGWDGETNSFVVYGDVTVSGTVTATAFTPQ